MAFKTLFTFAMKHISKLNRIVNVIRMKHYFIHQDWIGSSKVQNGDELNMKFQWIERKQHGHAMHIRGGFLIRMWRLMPNFPLERISTHPKGQAFFFFLNPVYTTATTKS